MSAFSSGHEVSVLLGSEVEASMIIANRAESGRRSRLEIVSPATGERIGSVALGQPEDVDRAVRAASEAWPRWAAATVFTRVEAMRRVAEAITSRRDRLSTLLTLEQGKPLIESRAEVDETLTAIECAIDGVKRLEGAMPPSADPAKRVFVYRVPRGVVASIQPWNYPLVIAAQFFSALLSGNCVVTLPAPTTSLVTYELALCFLDAELPSGVVNLLTGRGDVVGEALTGHKGIEAVVFTGSTAVGRHVAHRASGKALILELGGNGPTVVLDDANLERATAAAISSSLLGSGQGCTCGERFLVHDAVYDDFAEMVTDAVATRVRLGNPFDGEVTMGPLHNEATAAKVDRHVEQAKAAGAAVLAGGRRAAGLPTNLYWEPTVLADVKAEMDVAREETFGPVIPLERIASESEAHDRIDRAEHGLAAAVFTRDLARGLRFAERASAGMININEGSTYTEYHLPFGGRAGKSSGLGRNGGHYPIEDVFTERKTVIAHIED